MNNLSLLFLKLSLKNNNYVLNKINLKAKFFIKSFYKNEDFLFTNVLNNINNNILFKFQYFLSDFLYYYKLLIYIYVKNYKVTFTGDESYTNLYIDIYHSKNKYLLPSNLITKKNNSSRIFSNILYNYYFLKFIFSLNLKFLVGNKLKNSKLPNSISKLTLLRSPHIDKKSREQFEILVHKSFISSLNLFDEEISSFLKTKNDSSYIELLF
jgi:hypothetical protein